MEAVKQLPLSDAVYNTLAKLRYWNCRTTALRCRHDKTTAKLIRKFRPDLDRKSHLSLALYHADRAVKLKKIYGKVLERAALETFKRPWRIMDYKVSGIGSDEFAERHKRVLRHCIHRAGEHEDMSSAHAILAKRAPKANATGGSRP